MAVVLAVAALCGLYRATLISELRNNTSGDWNVALLAPLAAGHVAWARRGRLRALAPRPYWLALPCVAIGALLWWVGDAVAWNVLRQAAWLTMLGATVLGVLGGPAFRVLLPALGLLAFGLNVFYPLIPALMQVTAHAAYGLLRALGAELHGLTLVLPFGRWRIIEACSGLDYLLVFTMAGVLVAATAKRGWRERILCVATAAGAAVLANVVRACAIIGSAALNHGVDLDHDIIGWLCFGAFFMLWLAAAGRGAPDARGTEVPPEPAADAGGFAPGSAIAAALLAVAIAALAPVARAFDAGDARADAAASCDAPLVRTAIDGRTEVTTAQLRCTGTSALQNLLDWPLHLAAAQCGPVGLAQGTRSLGVAGRERPVDAATLESIATRPACRLSYWYETADAATGSRTRLKWLVALERLAGRDPIVVLNIESRVEDAAAQ